MRKLLALLALICATSFVLADGLVHSVAGFGLLGGTNTWTGLNTFSPGGIAAAKVNKVTITQPATGATFTLTDGKTLTVQNTLTLAGTDTSTLNIGSGGTLGSAAFVNIGTSGGVLCELNANCTWSSTDTMTFPDGTTVTSSGFTFGIAVALGAHSLTGALNMSVNAAAGFGAPNASCTGGATTVTVEPDRANATAGLGCHGVAGDWGLIGGSAEQLWGDGTFVHLGTGLAVTNLLISPTAPTVSSGFGTSPSISANNGTAAFQVNVGTGGVATSGIIGLPTATNGWALSCADVTTSGHITTQVASTTTTASVSSAVAWSASDKLNCSAHAF